MRPLPVTADHERTVGDCRYCPKMCRVACPVAEAEASEAATPTWKGTLAHAWMRGETPLAGPVAEAAYRCTDCLLSRTYCLHEHEVPEPYQVVRSAAMAEGVAPLLARTYAERVRRLGNPFEADLSRRLEAIAAPGEAREAALLADGARADAVLFPGCAAVRHDLDLVRDARAVTERVERAPLRCAASGAGCCGYPLWSAGDV
ncbi:MAG TPA: (Fe-S)-binding protein, partial [Planctomycetota bacterium]|nr:(Fe-S)-binding protein [Planctomycetota bacterium]